MTDMLDDEDEKPKFELTEERKEAFKVIAAKVKEAQALINECCVIADKNNVAFSFYRIGNMNNHYIPENGGIDEYGDDYSGYDGWQSSSC